MGRALIAAVFIVAMCVGMVTAFIFATHVHARNTDGRYAASPLKDWFDALRSEKGLCCSNADGLTVRDADWDANGEHYRVRLDGEWLEVPNEAVVRRPNLFGTAVVWPYQENGKTAIRCFIAGALS